VVAAKEMLIRPASPLDLLSITQITNALLSTTTYEWTETPYTLEERASWLRDQEAASFPVLVAVEEQTVVGWASYSDFRNSKRWPGYRYTVEHTIHIVESYWGRGIGRALIAELVDLARAEGKRVMVAGIDASNAPSIRFHSKLGFREVARMPGIGEKWGARLELVLMQRDLDKPIV
jgi:L-amino acid N-acyltransferase YncA